MIVKKSFNQSSRSILFFTLIFFLSVLVFSFSSDSAEPDDGDGKIITDPPVIVDPPEDEDTDPVSESEVPVGPSILKINSGGGELTFDSEVFEEDKYFTGDVDSFENHIATEIAETEMDELYLTERSSDAISGSFVYAIPVTNGTYTVKFHFAEIVWGAINNPDYPREDRRRIFDVDAEGE